MSPVAPQAHQPGLERLQAAGLEPRLPEPPRGVEEVEVRGPGQREAAPVEAEPRVEERHVEHLAVEGDQAVEARQLLRERVEERRLLVVVPHEVLADDEAVAVHPADADQEGGGSRPAGEAGRLGVEEDGAAQVEAFQLRLRGEDPDGGRLDRVDARERHVTVAHLQVDRGLDEEELAALVLDPHPLDELLERDGSGPAAAPSP